MKNLVVFLLFLSQNIFSGLTYFSDDLDEFTDEREISLLIVGDKHSSFLPKAIGITCDTSSKPFLILQQGILFSTKPNLLVTLRFDKNEPMKRSFSYSSKASALSNRDIGFIEWFLDELRNSNNLIVKVEGEDIMRFTDLNESSKHVSEFLTAASELPPSTCNLN